jgi:hypothetical protein
VTDGRLLNSKDNNGMGDDLRLGQYKPFLGALASAP